jgi:hypothetical protein
MPLPAARPPTGQPAARGGRRVCKTISGSTGFDPGRRRSPSRTSGLPRQASQPRTVFGVRGWANRLKSDSHPLFLSRAKTKNRTRIFKKKCPGFLTQNLTISRESVYETNQFRKILSLPLTIGSIGEKGPSGPGAVETGRPTRGMAGGQQPDDGNRAQPKSLWRRCGCGPNTRVPCMLVRMVRATK